MSDISTLYDINVWLDGDSMPPGDWPEPRHKVVYLDPSDDYDLARSNVEILQADKWRVGVISRVALRLFRELLDQNVAADHGCASRYGHTDVLGEFCGGLYVYHLIDQPRNMIEGDVGYVGVIVPAKQAELWADRARHLVKRVIATDAEPTPPDHEHEQVVLTDPTAELRKATT